MTTRTPAPVAVDTGAATPVALDRAPAPVPVFVDTVPAVTSPPERAPAPVNTVADPELPQPQPRPPRASATRAAPAPDPYPEEPVAAVIPVEEQPVPEIPPVEPDANIAADTSRYITVSEDGAVVLINASTLNFVGSAVEVTGNDSVATITVTSATEYGNTNVATLLSAFGSNTVSTTGNITAGYFLGNGSQLTGLPVDYSNSNVVSLLAGFGSNNVSTTGNITAGVITADYFIGNGLYGNQTDDTAVLGNASGDVQVYAQDTGVGIQTWTGSVYNTWTFDAAGDLSAPGAVTATSQVYAQYFDIKGPGAAGSSIGILGYAGNIVNLYGINGVEIVTGADPEGSTRWEFDTTGNLSLAGNLQFPNGAEIRDVNGDLRLRAAPGDVTQLQGLTTDGAVDAAVQAFHDIETGGYVTINTNIDAVEHVWTFDYNGDLTVPNYINFAGNTYIGDEPGAGSPVFRIVAPLTYGATIETDADISGNNWTWTFGADGIMSVAGNISFGGDASAAPSLNDFRSVTSAVAFDIIANSTGTSQTFAFDVSGNLTVPGNVVANVSGYSIGYRDIPQVAFTGNVTMAAADAGKHYYSTQSTDYTLTIDDNGNVSWPVGTAVSVVNRGTGNITVAQTAGVSLYLAGNSTAGNRVVTTYGMATLLNVAANVWMINGTGVV